MLSKLMMRGAFASRATPFMGMTSVRSFRNDFVNPYKAAPIHLNEAERVAQEKLPVWERVFDHKRYMEHEGPLKVNDLL